MATKPLKDVIDDALGFDGYATDEFIAAALKAAGHGDLSELEVRALTDRLGFKREGRFVYYPVTVKLTNEQLDELIRTTRV